MKHTNSVPCETSHPLRSELNEKAPVNMYRYKEDIDWSITQVMKIIQKEK